MLLGAQTMDVVKDKGVEKLSSVLHVRQDKQAEIGKRLRDMVDSCLEFDIRGD